jgi:phosphatidylserine decarboxylase
VTAAFFSDIMSRWVNIFLQGRSALADRRHDELIVREGWPFVIPLVVLFGLGLALDFPFWLVSGFGISAVFVIYFFRNPYRQVPGDSDVIVAPADGKIVGIENQSDETVRISIFLNVFNVHVNRAPIGGEITGVQYRPGKFFTANQAKASSENEQNEVVIEDGQFAIKVTQIAGAIARRIVCWKAGGDVVMLGERFGLIRFGSRVDLVLPQSCKIDVGIGQKVKGGSDVIAHRR